MNKVLLTKDNHLTYWYGDDRNNRWRSHHLDLANMEVGGMISDKTFIGSLEDTAEAMHAVHGPTFRIFLSGGLDSEVACTTFIRRNLKFIPVIVKFSNGLNQHDIHRAFSFCKRWDITPIVIEFDPVKFYRSKRWLRIAVDYQAYTFYQQMLLSVIEDHPHPCITVDEIEIQRSLDGWVFVKKEDQDGCWHRFAEKTGIAARNNFYTYDPTTIARFIESSTIVDLVSNKLPGKIGWSSLKHAVYSELTGWEIDPRPKMHGMEKMMEVWYEVENQSILELGYTPVSFEVPFANLQASIGGKIVSCQSS